MLKLFNMMKKLVSAIITVIVILGSAAPARGAEPDTDPVEWIIRYVDDNIERGDIYRKNGYLLQANFHYNQAYAALASFRYSIQYVGRMRMDAEAAEKQKEAQDVKLDEKDKETLDEFDGGELSSMLEGLMGFANSLNKAVNSFSEKAEVFAEKTEKLLGEMGIEIDSDTGLVDQFDTFTRISISSPFPYLFNGYIAGREGKAQDAVRDFALALVNPWMPEDVPSFDSVYDLPLDELRAVRRRLVRKEGSMASKLDFEGPSVDQEPFNWLYLLHVSRAAGAMNEITPTLKKTESPEQAAIKHVLAAAYAFPFDPEIFQLGAELSKESRNHELFSWFIREGLIIAPGHKGLESLLKSWSE